MNKIEGIFFPGPFAVAVIDLKSDVRGNPRRLNRGHVGSDYFGVGEFVGKVTVSRKWPVNRSASKNRTQLGVDLHCP